MEYSNGQFEYDVLAKQPPPKKSQLGRLVDRLINKRWTVPPHRQPDFDTQYTPNLKQTLRAHPTPSFPLLLAAIPKPAFNAPRMPGYVEYEGRDALGAGTHGVLCTAEGYCG